MSDVRIEALAEVLHDSMERLDHATGKKWNELPDGDKEFYRHCIMAIVREEALLMTLIAEQKALPQ